MGSVGLFISGSKVRVLDGHHSDRALPRIRRCARFLFCPGWTCG